MAKIIITDVGNKFYYEGYHYHREDGPAQIWSDGGWRWRQNHQHHREGAPAAFMANGRYIWMVSDYSHREAGPASDSPCGWKRWSNNGIIIWPEL